MSHTKNCCMVPLLKVTSACLIWQPPPTIITLVPTQLSLSEELCSRGLSQAMAATAMTFVVVNYLLQVVFFICAILVIMMTPTTRHGRHLFIFSKSFFFFHPSFYHSHSLFRGVPLRGHGIRAIDKQKEAYIQLCLCP